MRTASALSLSLLLSLLPALAPGPTTAAPARKAAAPSIPDAVRACSVTVAVDGGGASGTLFRDAAGCWWCLTAAHVVEGHAGPVRVTRHLQGEDGSDRGVWASGPVVRVGKKPDLTVVRLGAAPIPGARPAVLYAGKTPGPDTPVFVCGSQGLFFHHSLHRGFVTALGRVNGGTLCDENDIAGGPGTSGCGVFLRRGGALAGVHVASNRLRSGLYVPARVVRAWAGRAGVAGALDSSQPAPDEAALRSGPAEVD